MDLACVGRPQGDREKLLQNYRKLGLNVSLAADAVEAGIQQTWQLLVANQPTPTGAAGLVGARRHTR